MKRKKIKIPFTDKVIVDEKFLTECECYKANSDSFNTVVNTVLMGGQCIYVVYKGINHYAVCMQIDDFMLPIKSFPFGDDKEYARLCAEELWEKLNEEI